LIHVHRIRPTLIHVGVFNAAVQTAVSEEIQQKGVATELQEAAAHLASLRTTNNIQNS
jgi:hypothetical protein